MASQCRPILVYGRRRVRPEQLDAFTARFSDRAASASYRACFAFPDLADPTAYFHIYMLSEEQAETAFHEEVLPSETNQGLKETYASTPEDPDRLEVYGGWTQAMRDAATVDGTVTYNFHTPLAGFIKEHGAADEPGPPMFGFTRRFVQPGHLKALAADFQRVCDRWHERTPGILCATVSADAKVPHMVHDLRIFANRRAYDAHVDKADEVLTAAMADWFEHYDRSVPFEGELFVGGSTNEDGLHSSSIKAATTARPQMAMYYFGSPEMLGTVPDMAQR